MDAIGMFVQSWAVDIDEQYFFPAHRHFYHSQDF